MDFSAGSGTGTMSPLGSVGTPPPPITVPASTFTPPSGYEFDNWYAAATGTYYNPGDSVPDGGGATFTITLTAQYTVIPVYFVTFQPGAGSGSMAAVSGPAGYSFTTPTCSFTPPPGQQFLEYDSGAHGIISNGYNYVITGPDVVTAFYANIPYTVTFEPNGAAQGPYTQTDNASAPLTANSFTYATKFFTGWNTAADGSGTAYTDGETYAFTSGLTLYAQWESSPTAPSAPTLTTPLPGAVEDIRHIINLGANYNTTDGRSQNAWALRLKINSGSYNYWNASTASWSATIVWNTDSVPVAGSWIVALPAGALTGWDATISWSMASQESGGNLQGSFAADTTFITGIPPTAAGVTVSLSEGSPAVTLHDYVTANVGVFFLEAGTTNWGQAPEGIVPWMLPVAINDHPYMIDFKGSRITTMQIRRVSADDSVEPGEQTLSASGVWPRAQDNYFLGAGQEFLDNRFAFESVYVHSGEYPSVRTRFWKSLGVNPWNEGKLTLQPEYEGIATSTANLVIVVCGNYLYKTDGIHLYFTLNPVGVASPSWSLVTSANTHNIVSLTSDGSRVWFACGTDGVYVTSAGSSSSTTAATPAALNGIGGLSAYAAGAGTVNATNLPNGSTTWYVTELDAFGNETAAVSVTATVAGTPMNITWNPDTNATLFNVYRGTGTLVYQGDTPSFVDDGTVAGASQTRPTSNGTGVTPYEATFILYAKGHLIASTGRDLVEILADSDITFIYQHENPNFVWTCGCECPTAILVGGYAGSQSFVGAIQPDSSNNGATLAPPTWASTMTPGEQINDIQYDSGAILIATSLGIRSGTKPDATGTFDVNPVIEDPGNVTCVTSWSQYMYFGWSNFNAAEPWAPTRPAVSGLGRADLSQYTTPGVPAYATDAMGQSAGVTTAVVTMAGLAGTTAGVPYFVVLESGTYTLYGPDNKVVPSGWLEPGWVRYGTLENKIVVEVDFQHKPLPAGASVSYNIIYEDEATNAFIGSNTTAESTTVDEPLLAGLMVGDRFMPIITLTSTPAQDVGPIFLSHITKAMVVTNRQDEILLALVFADEVLGLGPDSKTWYMNCLNEYAYLKSLEKAGIIVTLTMGAMVRSCFIDQIMLEPENVDQYRDWFMGALTVKLISLD